MHVSRIALGIVLGVATAGAAAALYKWVDEKGRVQYSDKPPTEKDKGGVQMTNRGVVVKKLEGGMTAEQKKAKDEEDARKRADQQKALEQKRHDVALLQSFSSAREIDMKRDREVQAIESVIANLRGQERTVTERIVDDRRRAEQLDRRKEAAPDSLKEDIKRAEAEKKVIGEEIVRREQDIKATHSKYDALKHRYLELRPEGAAGSIMQPTSAAPQAASKK